MKKQNKDRPSFSPCSEKQKVLLTDFTTDLIVSGGGAGGGKSHCCLVKYLPNNLCKGIADSEFKGIIFRRTIPELKISGGIIDSSKKIYPHFGGVYKAQAMLWQFPSGATIQFRPIPDDLDTLQSMQVTNIMVDEAAAGWKESEIIFLLSRMRSTTYSGKMQMTLSCNPDNKSFLYKWVKYSLDEFGIPLKGTEDKTRYFLSLDGSIVWGDSKEEMIREYGHKFRTIDLCQPKTMRFIPMGLYDNKVLMQNMPEYESNLLAQPRVNQLRYLFGSWEAKEETGGYFKREWVKMVDAPSDNATMRVRSWDLAFTENKASDYTASVLMSRDKLGIYTVEHVCRFKKLPDGVLQEIASYGLSDGDGVVTTIPRDNGGGAASAAFFVKQLAEKGVVVRTIQMSGASSKSKRFLPFSAVAQAGFVRVVKADWNDWYFQELEDFVDKCRGQHDDSFDSTSDCFNTLAKQLQLPTFSIPDLSRASLSSRCS